MSKYSELASTLLQVIFWGITLIGGLMFGFGVGVISAHLILTLVLGSIGPDGWGAAPAWAVLCIAAGIIGALAGLFLAITILRSASDQLFHWIELVIALTACVIAAAITQLAFSSYYPLVRLVPLSAIAPMIAAFSIWIWRNWFRSEEQTSSRD